MNVTQGLMSGIRNNKKRAKMFELILITSGFEKLLKPLQGGAIRLDSTMKIGSRWDINHDKCCV